MVYYLVGQIQAYQSVLVLCLDLAWICPTSASIMNTYNVQPQERVIIVYKLLDHTVINIA